MKEMPSMPKAAKKGDDAPKKVFDIEKPGKAAPSASSRPIIVKRQSLAQDPMVRDNDAGEVLGPPAVDENNKEVKKMLHPTDARVSIKPDVSDTEKPEEQKKDKEKPEESNAAETAPNEQVVTDSSSNEPKDDQESQQSDEESDKTPQDTDKAPQASPEAASEDTAKDSKAPQQKPSADKPDQTTNAQENNDEVDGAAVVESPQPDSIVDELAKQAVSKKQKEKEDKEAAAKTEKIQKLIDEKTYFLPIGRATRRRNTRRVLIVILLLLIIGVVAADLVIDAGLVKTDIKPVTHLFNSWLVLGSTHTIGRTWLRNY